MNAENATKYALVTGAARRIGAGIVRVLHAAGYNVVVHYHGSESDARTLCDELNRVRGDSVFTIRADLRNLDEVAVMFEKVFVRQPGLDLLVNNASVFYPTPFGSVSFQQWEDLMNANLRAPFFLCQHAADGLRSRGGSIVNIIDIAGERPRKGYSPYSISRAGLVMLTRALADELAPQVRVNGVSPGPILWPEHEASIDASTKAAILEQTPLKRTGTTQDVAEAVLFLAEEASYLTGQIIAVDGGRGLKPR